MKTIHLILVASFLLIAQSSFAQKIHWGYLNSSEIYEVIPEAQQAELQIEVELEKMEQQLNEKYKLLQKLQSNGASNELKGVTKASANADKLQQELIQLEREIEDTAINLREELYAPIDAMIAGVVADIAQEKNLQYVLDTAEQDLIYANPAADITQAVIQIINNK